MGFRQSTLEEVVSAMDLDFYRGKRVFLTGHTGFKGTWMSKILIDAGAVLTGYSLEPPTQPSLFELSGIADKMTHTIGDVRNFDTLLRAFQATKPEIVFHLAAQPIVRESYQTPRGTYETNVMGTVNLLECVRLTGGVQSVLNVTTDKVYENHEWLWGYRESEPLNGYDPYSNSKSCSELVTYSYINSFFREKKIAVSTARAGNVIGGGDFARDRIIPDCVRAAVEGTPIIVRNPHSTRPYQHVLEPVFAYLMMAERQFGHADIAGSYNVGPDDCDCVTTGTLVDLFCQAWGEGQTWENRFMGGPHEANFLKLDCSKIKTTYTWQPKWHIRDAVEKTVEWSKSWQRKEQISQVMEAQIQSYLQ